MSASFRSTLRNFCLVLGIVGAGSLARSGGAQTPDAGPSVEPDGRATNDLRLGFTPGREFVYRIATRRIVKQEGEKKPYQSEAKFTLHAKTQSVADREATLQYRFERVEWSVSGSPADGSFDSQSRPSSGEPPMFASARAMIGKPFLVVLGDRGQVLTVRGQGIKPDEKKPNAPAMQLVSDSQLRSLLITQYSWMPSDEVAGQAPWTREEELNLGFLSLVRKNEVSIVSTGGGRAHLRSTIRIEDRPGGGLSQNEIRITGKVFSSKPGVADIVFHQRLGMLESLTASVAFEMQMNAEPRSKKDKADSVRQAMEAVTEVRLLAVDGRQIPLAN
ncbi:MAG: hypothetical protein U1D30_12930 [Planctomycetota bacterium]